MKKNIINFLILSLIYLSIVGIKNLYPPFYAMEKLLIPIEDSQIIFTYLIFNFAMIVIFIVDVVKKLDEFIQMYPYIIIRNVKKNINTYLIKGLSKTILNFIVIKLIVDIIFGNINSINNIEIFIKLNISTYLTLIIWTFVSEILFVVTTDLRKSMFFSLFIIYLVQYLSLKYSIIPILAIANESLYKDFVVIIIFKLILITVLFCITSILFKKREILGGEKND